MKNLAFAALVHDTFWAIHVQAGNLLLQQLRSIDADRHSAEYFAKRAEAEREISAGPVTGSYEDRYGASDDGIAQIRISGPMTKAVTSMDEGTSTVKVRRQIRAAVADPAIKGLMMVIDSPGGSVSGTNDLGEDVAAASKKKLTVSYIEDMGCSAAYWTASQAAGGIYGNSTCMVGSIGTVMVAYDASRMFENAGIEALVFSTGGLKGAGAMGAAITDEQRAAFQKTVDDLNDHFLSAVSRGRNMARAKVEQLADGGVLIGKAAQKAGLIDGISSADEVLNSMKQRVSRKKAGASAENDNDFTLEGPLPVGASLEQSLDAAHAAVEDVTARVARVITLRAEQGRRLSASRIGQIRTLHGSLANLIESCSPLASSEEELKEVASSVLTESSSSSLDPDVVAALATALTASESDLDTYRQAG